MFLIPEIEIGFIDLDKFFFTTFFYKDSSTRKMNGISRESDNSLDIVFSIAINMWSDDNDISANGISDMDRKEMEEFFREFCCSIFCVVIYSLICFSKIEIREFIDQDIFFIMITIFHRTPIDPKWSDDKRSDENHNQEYDNKISKKTDKFIHDVISFLYIN